MADKKHNCCIKVAEAEWKAVKHYCIDHDRKVGEFIESAIRNELKRVKEES